MSGKRCPTPLSECECDEGRCQLGYGWWLDDSSEEQPIIPSNASTSTAPRDGEYFHPSPDEVRALAAVLRVGRGQEIKRDTLNRAADLLEALLARAEGAERERDEARPWVLFYRDGKTLGEVVQACGGTIYSYTPWLTAPCARITGEAIARAETAEASLTLALEALKEIGYSGGGWPAVRARQALSTLSASLEKQEVSSSVDESAASAFGLTGQQLRAALGEWEKGQ